MTELYIYYRVQEQRAAELAPQVVAMQQRLSAELGVQAQLKRRPNAKDGLQTWMEVYLATPAGFDGALDEAVKQSGILAWIDGERHTEVFMDIAPCA